MKKTILIKLDHKRDSTHKIWGRVNLSKAGFKGLDYGVPLSQVKTKSQGPAINMKLTPPSRGFLLIKP